MTLRSAYLSIHLYVLGWSHCKSPCKFIIEIATPNVVGWLSANFEICWVIREREGEWGREKERGREGGEDSEYMYFIACQNYEQLSRGHLVRPTKH